MPPIKIETYDYNFTPYSNLRSNFLANRMGENRWGHKFKRIYTKHMDAPIIPGTVGNYDFTAGLRTEFGTLESYNADLAAAQDLRSSLQENMSVETDGVWSISGALVYSYMAVLLERVEDDSSVLPRTEVRGVRMALCLNDGDDRKIAWWHESGVVDGSASVLHALYDPTDDYGVRLVSDDGVSYGHYDGGLRDGTTHENVLDLYTVEDRANERFAEDQESRFDAVWASLLTHIAMMVKVDAPDEIGDRVSVVVSLNMLMHWLDRRISNIEEGITELSSGDTRSADDLALLDHLEMEETLKSEIEDPSDIERIWFKLQKTISPPTVTNDDGTESVDRSYAWWEEEQFDEIRGKFKDFQAFCVVSWGADSTAGDDGMPVGVTRVYLSDVLWTLSGHKIYWLVCAFLDIGVEVEDPPWWQRLWNFVVYAFSIYQIINGGSPLWMKALLITTATMGYLGVLTPELALVVTVISMANGLYSADFSSMSSMQMFQFAVKNINMLVKMQSLYTMIQLEGDEEQEEHPVVEEQEVSMQYIYSSAYSQYDQLYEMLYDWEPPVPGAVNTDKR